MQTCEHDMISENLAVFGHYALPPRREAIRRRADKCRNTRMGRWAISFFRKRAFRGISDPFDIEIAPHVSARLWPRSSRCEKRVFAGHQVWDAQERAFLKRALANHDSAQGAFVFLDIGANVGLYSLFLAAKAKELAMDIHILAVEPDPTNRGRLEFNAQASGADIKIAPCAISDEAGMGSMGGGDVNRGEMRLVETDANGDPVEIMTLLDVCTRNNISSIHAMKLDIEGHDERALRSFFTHAPQAL
ncbi:MAG TPA: FkbM family methyltransferase, partial [Hellea balneolensis]|nr:FkbM family methyltransferase [Hellea balneolensis]